jgi:lipopolysaccharide-induced tumor necrosis factor-alpha factor
MAFKCPFCSHEGMPTTEKRVSVGGWVLFAVLLLLCFPVCWIPFVVDGCKEEIRRCASCGSRLGS